MAKVVVRDGFTGSDGGGAVYPSRSKTVGAAAPDDISLQGGVCMMKWILIVALLLLATQALAETFTETFDDPLGGWRSRWLALNSNMTNYYVCTGQTGDENYRGNNPCGIWICDSDQDFTTAIITFSPSFGSTITHFELGIQAFTTSNLVIYDMDGNQIFTANLTTDFSSPYGCFTTPFSVDSSNGIGGFSILGGGVEGNTAVDNFTAITGEPTPVEHTTWGHVKAMYR